MAKPAEKEMMEIGEEYSASLADLTVNSKPLITMLTMLAEENKSHAAVIVKAIEEHIKKCVGPQKLPSLYLLDSIIKNVGGDYIRLFALNIINTFSGVFAKNEEKVRKKLYELRLTWTDVLPKSRLYMLDITVNNLDPAWPMTVHTPTAGNPSKGKIFINPNLIKGGNLKDISSKKSVSHIDLKKYENELLNERKELEKMKKEEELIRKEKIKLEMIKQTNKNIHINPEQANKILPIPSRNRDPRSSRDSQDLRESRDPRIPRDSRDPRESKPSRDPRTPEYKDSRGSSREPPRDSRDPRDSRGSSKNPPRDSRDSRDSRGSSRDPPRDSKDLSRDARDSRDPRAARDSQDSRIARDPRASQGLIDSRNIRDSRDPRMRNDSRDSDERGDPKDFRNVELKETKDSRDPRVPEIPSKLISRDPRFLGSPSRFANPPPDAVSTPKTTITTNTEGKINQVPDIPSLKPSEKTNELPNNLKQFNTETSIRLDKQLKEKANQNLKLATPVPTNINIPIPAKPVVEPALVSQVQNTITVKSTKTIENTVESCIPKPQPVKENEELTSSNEMFQSLNQQDSESDSDHYEGNKPPQLNTSRRGKSSISEDKDSSSEKVSKDKSSLEDRLAKEKSTDCLFGKEDVDLRQITGRVSLPTTGPFAPIPPVKLPAAFGGPVESMEKSESMPADLGMSKLSVNESNSASWEKFREKNPEFKKYERTSRLDSGSNYFVDEEGQNDEDESEIDEDEVERKRDEEMDDKPTASASSILPPSGQSQTLFSKDISQDDSMEDDQDFSRNEAMKRNYQSIIIQAEEQLSKNEISMAQYNQLLFTVVRLLEQDKIKEARKAFKFKNRDGEGSQNLMIEPSTQNIKDKGPNFPLQPSNQNFKSDKEKRQNISAEDNLKFNRGPNAKNDKWNRGPKRGGFFNAATGRRQLLAQVLTYDDISSAESELDDEYTNEPDLPSVSEHILFEVSKEPFTRTIRIDDSPKEIRTYGETAVILFEYGEPRLIGFERVQCNIVFDQNRFVIPMAIGDDYKEFTIDGEQHRIKLGVPTQELFIDGKGYQCFFGGKPISVHLAGKNRTIHLEGKSPAVKIGDINLDFIVGKVQLVINAKKGIPLYLDARPQKFYIDGKPFVLKFADQLKSVVINGIKFDVEFDGMPINISVRGRRKFLAFSTLPPGIIPGKVHIYGMDSTDLIPNYTGCFPKVKPPVIPEKFPAKLSINPPPAPPNVLLNLPDMNNPRPSVPIGGIASQMSQPPMPPTLRPIIHPNSQPPLPSGPPPTSMVPPLLPTRPPIPPPNLGLPIMPPMIRPSPGMPHAPMSAPFNLPPTNLLNQPPNNLINQLPPSTLMNQPPPTSLMNQPPPTTMMNQVSQPPRPPFLAPPPPFSHATSSHEVTPGSYIISGGNPLPPPPPRTPLPPSLSQSGSQNNAIDVNYLLESLYRTGILSSKPDTPNSKLQMEEEPEITKEEEEDPEDFIISVEKMMKSDNLKKRSKRRINYLYNGMQCVTCGIRFSTEQTIQYSRHLDWHYRQEKRLKKLQKTSTTRQYFCNISEWIDFYDEITEKAEMFENPKDMLEDEDVQAENEPCIRVNQDDPSAGVCPHCHETFYQMFKAETNDWYYRNAVLLDGSNYHPACLPHKIKPEKMIKEEFSQEPPIRIRRLPSLEELIPSLSEPKRLPMIELDSDEPMSQDNSPQNSSQNVQNDQDRDRISEISISKINSLIHGIKNATSTTPPVENVNISPPSPPPPQPTLIPLNVSTSPNKSILIKKEPVEKEQPSVPEVVIKKEIKIEPIDTSQNINSISVIDSDEMDTSVSLPIRQEMNNVSTVVKSSMDGNLELDKSLEMEKLKTGAKIKISLLSSNQNSSNNNNVTNINGVSDKDETTFKEMSNGKSQDFIEPPFTVDYERKPAFKGVTLSKQPLVFDGIEASGLCSIM